MVILTWNQLDCTKECIESIRRHTPEPHEIIFVDNGSTDGTVKWLRQQVKENATYRLIENKKNLGFAKGCNQGIEAATGDLILLINNDVVVTAQWLAGLQEVLASAPEIGIVGPMTNNISGPQRVQKVAYEGRNGLDEYAASFRGRYRHRRLPLQRIVGFCMLFRRQLVQRIGLLDERFGSGNFEDDDFCLRAELAGFRNMVAADVFIHHHGSKSFVGNRLDYGGTIIANRSLYDEKWGGVLSASLEGKQLLALKALRMSAEFHEVWDEEKAVQVLREGINHLPDDARLRFALAELLLDIGDPTEALVTLGEMPDTFRRDHGWLQLTGYAMASQDDLAGATQILELLKANGVESAFGCNLAGIIAHKQGESQPASEHFSRATQIDPSFAEAWSNLGVIRWSSGEHAEALELLERGCNLAPTNREIVSLYQTAATELGEFSRAEELFRTALGFYPRNRRLRFFLIDALITQGKDAQALSMIEQAVVDYGLDDGIIAAGNALREKVGPRTLPMEKKGSISLCMIVKNEELHLPRCLSSLSAVVDEMIIVDTGSTDRTREIASLFGARLLETTWDNDFSRARNLSLEAAQGEWVLVMDADEVLSPVDHGLLRELVAKGRRQAYRFTTRNYVARVNVEGWNANDGRYCKEEAGSGWSPSVKVRLFPNDQRIRFENPVHEMVEPSLMRIGVPVVESLIPVHHYGKLDEEKELAKGEAYYLMGVKKLAEKGDDVTALCELAIQAQSLKRYEEAIDLWRRTLRLNPQIPLAHLNLSGIFIDLERFHEGLVAAKRACELQPDLKEASYNLALCEMYVGDVTHMVSLLDALVKRHPDYPAARIMLAIGSLFAGDERRATELFSQLSTLNIDLQNPLAAFARKLSLVGRDNYAQALCQMAEEAGVMRPAAAVGSFVHGQTPPGERLALS
jgi:GT2 family glycosyltransferase/Flp pilus assembly protein TadD